MIKSRIAAIRKIMVEEKVDWLYVPSEDFHQSEYVRDYFKCREKLSIQMRKMEEQSVELEKLKNSLVTMQVKYENLEASAKLVEKKYQEAKARIARLDNIQKNSVI